MSFHNDTNPGQLIERIDGDEANMETLRAAGLIRKTTAPVKILGDGDVDEILPYVNAGFAVIAYEIDGPYMEEDEEGFPPFAEASASTRRRKVWASSFWMNSSPTS